MQFFGRLLLSVALHIAAAKEQEQRWGQASGLSRSLFMQDASAFLAMDDSDLLDGVASRGAQGQNLRHQKGGHNAVVTAKQVRNSDKVVVSEASKATDAAKAETAKANAEAVKAVAAARTEAANAARLKTELTKAVRNQYALRNRLKQVGTEARTRLAQLLKQLQFAKAAAQRSESMLREEISKESVKLKTAVASEQQLKQKVAAEQASSLSSGQSAAAAATKASAHSEADLQAMHKLTSQLQLTQQSATAQTHKLQAQLDAMQKADATAQGKLSAQLKEASQASSKERTLLQAKIAAAQHASEKVSDDLESEQFSEKLLRANLTHLAQSAELAAAEARKEKMGLLVQVSELQEQSSGAQKKALAAEKEAKLAKEDANAKIDQEESSAKKQDAERQHRISALLQESQAAHSNLTSAASAAAAAKQQVMALQATVSQKEEQLREALLETNDLRAARDAATKGEAAFQKMDTTAEASLKAAKKEFSDAKSELQQVKSDLTSRVSDASTLTNKITTLNKQLIALKKSSATEEASAKQQMHDTMINAAGKVHDLEDQNENLTDDLSKVKKQLTAATAESSKDKDTLMQETDAALRSSQKADSLQNVLDQAQKEADASTARAESLSKTVAKLKADRDHSNSVIMQRSQDESEWQAKAENLESAAKTQDGQAKKAMSENKKLQDSVQQLTGEEQRADELEEELSGLREQMKKKNSEEASMAKKLEMLRSLKDHYSNEYESERNDTDVWHQKVTDLQDHLQKTKDQLQAVNHQRGKALERAKEARSQEDEYFEENSRLEQQDEALNAKLVEVGTAANRSKGENMDLQQKVEDLKDQQTREKANSHAAWVQNEGELMQAKRDLRLSLGVNRNLQAELARSQAVLSDKERQTLGLPALKKDATKKADSAAPAAVPAAVVEAPPAPVAEAVAVIETPPAPVSVPAPVVETPPAPVANPAVVVEAPPAPVAAPVVAKVVPLVEKPESPAAKPLTPQVREVKHWEKAKPAAKPLLAKASAKAAPKPAAKVVAPVAKPAAPVAKPVVKAAPAVVKSLPVKASVVKAQPVAAALPGEPAKPIDDAAAMLSSVTDPKVSASPIGSRSALQKLADFFASPLQR